MSKFCKLRCFFLGHDYIMTKINESRDWFQIRCERCDKLDPINTGIYEWRGWGEYRLKSNK